MRRRQFIGLVLGASAACSLAARAQAKMYVVALLTLEPGEDGTRLIAALRDLGYVEGRNLHLKYRAAEGDPVRLRALADELVATKPDVLVAGWGTLVPQALQAATHTIPIVFTTVGDPIGAGLVQSLAHPGGNMTGLSGQFAEFKGKQLQLLLTCVPGQSVVGVLSNPDTPYSALALDVLKAAATASRIRLERLDVTRPAELTAARMDALVANGATSLFVFEDPLASSLRTTVIEEANRLRLPIITGMADYVRDGALMTYGVSLADSARRTAEYVDKILRGAKPGDLPVQQPTIFQLIINLKTAKAFGIDVPPTLLALADEVIE
jgi:putative ABC transport system substrate-binding protein